MAALPPIDHQQLAQTLLENVAAAGGADGAVAGGGAAPAAATSHYIGDHMDIERIESSMKKFLSENCVDLNATVLRNIRTFSIMRLTCLRTKLLCMKLEMTWSGWHRMLKTPMHFQTW